MASSERPLRVLSVSLGSANRDKSVTIELLGRTITLERRGVDGDLQRARALFAEFDGRVDAFGLGGTDLYLVAAGRRYVVRESAALIRGVTQTPVLDGSGLKHTLERRAVAWLAASGHLDLGANRALVVSAVDRFGLAEALWERCAGVVYGDLMFALGIGYPIRSLAHLQRLARLLLPVIVRLPIRYLYPTGAAQATITPRWGRAYAEADLIAGDCHLIRRHLPPPGDPPPLAGKVILTNTTDERDVALFRERGAALLVTTTPVHDGRSFGTNVLEACFCALEGSREPLPPERLEALLDALDYAPQVSHLQESRP